MRKNIYAFGIATFLPMFIFTIATSLTNPFYGMSEAAIAQTSSTCSSGGSTSTSLCPSGCQHSCLEYITFTPGQLPPGNYTGWELEYGYNLCCTAKICQNGNWVDYPFENKYEICQPSSESTSSCTRCAEWGYYL